MKTMGFSDLLLIVSEEGIISLLVKKPGESQIEIRMSNEELLAFLMECTNKLYESSICISTGIAKKELEKERRKVK